MRSGELRIRAQWRLRWSRVICKFDGCQDWASVLRSEQRRLTDCDFCHEVDRVEGLVLFQVYC